MRALAPQYGFGFVSMKLKPQSTAAAAAYLSSYFVTGKREKAQLQESVRHPALKRGRIIWLSPKLPGRGRARSRRATDRAGSRSALDAGDDQPVVPRSAGGSQRSRRRRHCLTLL